MPRKPIRQKPRPSLNRIRPIQVDLIGTESSEEIWEKLMPVLEDTQVQVPPPGGIIIFQYFAMTPELLYDRYPVVGVQGVFDWGFTGVNLHLKDPRRYNFNQISSQMYQIKKVELDTLLALPLEYLVQNG